MDEENISEERARRWKSRFVPYLDLPESSKNKDRIFAEEILEKVGVEKKIEIEKFDDTLLKQKTEEKDSLILKQSSLGDTRIDLEKKLDELDDIKDNKESVSQKIQIEILELEKQLQKYLGEISVLENDKFRLERKISEFDTEEAFCRNIFSHEVNDILNKGENKHR